jgi:hypothetical protein
MVFFKSSYCSLVISPFASLRLRIVAGFSLGCVSATLSCGGCRIIHDMIYAITTRTATKTIHSYPIKAMFSHQRPCRGNIWCFIQQSPRKQLSLLLSLFSHGSRCPFAYNWFEGKAMTGLECPLTIACTVGVLAAIGRGLGG